MLRFVAAQLARMPQGAAAVVAAGWAGLIWWLLGGSSVAPEPWFWFMGYAYDLSHAAFFGVQAVWLALALRPRGGPAAAASPTAGPGALRPAGRDAAASPFGPVAGVWLLAAGAALAYGALMEWRQAAVPGRVASWFDLATDAVGAFGLPWVLARPTDGPRRAALVLLAAALTALAAREL